MDYKGLLADLDFIDLKCSLVAIEGKVGNLISTQEFIAFVRELAAFKRDINQRVNG